jgi:hypothetical protein
LAIQHRREREQAADLGAITGFRCYRAKIFSRVVGPRDGERLAHSILLWPESGLEDIESNVSTDSQSPGGESRFRTVGITATGIHLFKFGGLVRTARWLRAATDGDFRISDDETGFTVAD